MGMTIQKEDYIKVIFNLQQHMQGAIKTTVIAEALGVQPSSVTDMIKKLSDLEWISYVPYQGVLLTQKGQLLGSNIVRRHRILEMFLYRELGMSWELIHDEAERLEHAVSDEVIGRMDMKLGNPQFDPHGDPIPQEDGRVPSIDKATCLAGLNVGDVGKVVRISHDEKTFLEYLNSISVGLNTEVCVNAYYDFDESFDVLFDGKSCHISGFASRHIWVL